MKKLLIILLILLTIILIVYKVHKKIDPGYSYRSPNIISANNIV